MQYILDACTIINLIHIDEDDYLMKKLSLLEFKICNKVFEEVRKNTNYKYKSAKPYPIELANTNEQKLNYFRSKIHNDNSYLDLSDSISELFSYSKENGEYLSILLSCYLNTFEKTQILFITDDKPAKDFFNTFLNNNKIGYIEDSVDLLVLLYRQHQDFTSIFLKKYLSALYSEYTSEYSLIQKVVNEYQIPKYQIRNKEASINLDQIRNAFRNHDIELATKIYYRICEQKKENQYLYDLLSKHSSFFKKKPSTDLLKKITENMKFVDSQIFFKYFKN